MKKNILKFDSSRGGTGKNGSKGPSSKQQVFKMLRMLGCRDTEEMVDFLVPLGVQWSLFFDDNFNSLLEEMLDVARTRVQNEMRAAGIMGSKGMSAEEMDAMTETLFSESMEHMFSDLSYGMMGDDDLEFSLSPDYVADKEEADKKKEEEKEEDLDTDLEDEDEEDDDFEEDDEDDFEDEDEEEGFVDRKDMKKDTARFGLSLDEDDEDDDFEDEEEDDDFEDEDEEEDDDFEDEDEEDEDDEDDEDDGPDIKLPSLDDYMNLLAMHTLKVKIMNHFGKERPDLYDFVYYLLGEFPGFMKDED